MNNQGVFLFFVGCHGFWLRLRGVGVCVPLRLRRHHLHEQLARGAADAVLPRRTREYAGRGLRVKRVAPGAGAMPLMFTPDK